MSSLCIKTNNEKTLKYLQNEFSDFNMLNASFSCNEFKLYKNIIIHYTGIDKELFYTKLATIFSYLVIDNFEYDIIKIPESKTPNYNEVEILITDVINRINNNLL